MLNVEPSQVKYLTLAAEMGLGKNDLTKLNINRIKI